MQEQSEKGRDRSDMRGRRLIDRCVREDDATRQGDRRKLTAAHPVQLSGVVTQIEGVGTRRKSSLDDLTENAPALTFFYLRVHKKRAIDDHVSRAAPLEGRGMEKAGNYEVGRERLRCEEANKAPRRAGLEEAVAVELTPLLGRCCPSWVEEGQVRHWRGSHLSYSATTLPQQLGRQMTKADAALPSPIGILFRRLFGIRILTHHIASINTPPLWSCNRRIRSTPGEDQTCSLMLLVPFPTAALLPRSQAMGGSIIDLHSKVLISRAVLLDPDTTKLFPHLAEGTVLERVPSS